LPFKAPRAVLVAFGALGAVMTVVALSSTVSGSVHAQELEGTVRIERAISSVPVESGAFAVFVILEDFDHHGVVTYDDNRDTTPDREETSNGLGAFEFSIEYDASKLAFEGARSGPDLGRTGRTYQCLAPRQDEDLVTYGCISSGQGPDGPQGTLSLAQMTFRPVSAGSSPLYLSGEISGPLGSDNAPVEWVSGAVRVTGSQKTAPALTATSTAGIPPGPSPDAPATATALATITPANEATATSVAVALETVRPALTPATPGATPGATEAVDPPNSSDDDSDALLWWAGGVGAAIVLAGVGLGGVLWLRRR
jgi:hypothetical protein